MSEYIEATPDTRGGKPRIAGARITVADIVLTHRRLGRALEEIAGTYDLSLAAVYAAMAYYYDHKDEIDQSLDEEEFEHVDPAKNQRSANGAKWKSLGHRPRKRCHHSIRSAEGAA